MATITQLRPILQTQLRTVADRVFYEHTKGEPTFPYVVYDISSFTYGEVINQLQLEVNAYDNADDTTTLETLADSIWTLFDHKYYIDTNLEFSAYQNVRNNIDVPEKKIHQRRLVFTLRIC